MRHGCLHLSFAKTFIRMRSMTGRLQKSAVWRRWPRAGVAALAWLVAALALGSAAAQAPAPLPVDHAFAARASFEPGKFVLKLDVMPGHYLYRDRFEVEANGQPVAKLMLPSGKIKNDPNFGRVEVYEQPMSFSAATALTGATELTVVFQGCSEVAGVCYPPARRTFVLVAGAKDVRPRELESTSLKQQFKKQVSQ
jgi:thiol:disulfide interchange protein